MSKLQKEFFRLIEFSIGSICLMKLFVETKSFLAVLAKVFNVVLSIGAKNLIWW